MNASNIPDGLIDFVVSTFGTVLKLLRAGDDKTRQEEALMEHQEMVKEEIDRRAFSVSSGSDVSK